MSPRDTSKCCGNELIARLFAEHREDLFQFFVARGHRPQVADDFVQETFGRALRAVGQLKDRNRAKPWLLAIAASVRRSEFERRSAEKRDGEEIPVEKLDQGAPEIRSSTTPEADAIRADLRNRLVQKILLLPKRQRECLVLQVYQGRKVREIADILGISLGAVKKNIHRARTALAAMERDDE